MKKLIILLISIVLLTGCGKGEKKVSDNESKQDEVIELKQLDDSKDKVYLNIYRRLKLKDEVYELKLATVNLNSVDVTNVNLEMKSFVANCYSNMSLQDDVVLAGNIVDYEIIEYDKYVIVKQNYDFYFENTKMSENSNIYVIDYSTGKLLSNDDILKISSMSEDEMFEVLKKKIKSDDIDFTLMNIKNDGYKLYLNKNGKLVIYYVEVDNDGQYKRELILN